MDDNQDKIPLKQHEKILGHAVRANYLYAGVADLCLEEEDPDYMEVLHKVWRSLVDKKLYITGGCGALYNGASPYGYFLTISLCIRLMVMNISFRISRHIMRPVHLWAAFSGRTACSSWSQRQSTFDILERMMLNTNLAALSLDGKRFFYENMLRRAKSLTIS